MAVHKQSQKDRKKSANAVKQASTHNIMGLSSTSGDTNDSTVRPSKSSTAEEKIVKRSPVSQYSTSQNNTGSVASNDFQTFPTMELNRSNSGSTKASHNITPLPTKPPRSKYSQVPTVKKPSRSDNSLNGHSSSSKSSKSSEDKQLRQHKLARTNSTRSLSTVSTLSSTSSDPSIMTEETSSKTSLKVILRRVACAVVTLLIVLVVSITLSTSPSLINGKKTPKASPDVSATVLPTPSLRPTTMQNYPSLVSTSKTDELVGFWSWSWLPINPSHGLKLIWR